MRLKRIMVLALSLLLSMLFTQATYAQEPLPERTIPFKSVGFGAKLSPDGKTLVTFENIILLGLEEVDVSLLPIRMIDISTGEERGELSGFSDYTADAVFTSDGSRLISAHMNGDIYVWDVASMKVLKSFQEPLLGNMQIKLLPDDQRILVLQGGVAQRFLVIDTENGAITRTLGTHFDSYLDFQKNYTQFPEMGDIQFASFTLSPDGTLLASATANDEIGLWTIADNQYQVVRKKSEKFGLFSIRQLAFTSDGKLLVYYDFSDKKTHIWDVAAQSEQAALDIGADNFALSPDGTMIAWATRGKDVPNTVSIAPVDKPDQATVVLTIKDELQVAPRITWLTFTPDGKQLVVGGFFDQDEVGNEIYVVDVSS